MTRFRNKISCFYDHKYLPSGRLKTFVKELRIETAFIKENDLEDYDCYCRVFSDGTIKYEGLYNWQKSERVKPVFENGIDVSTGIRERNSAITESNYNALVKLIGKSDKVYNKWLDTCFYKEISYND